MKKLVFFLIFLPAWLTAQVPQGIHYQAVVRGADKQPITEQAVAIRFSIVHGPGVLNILYSERHLTQTNAFGLVNLTIGSGVPETGEFDRIDWSDQSLYLQVELAPEGDDEFVMMGLSPFVSVPFAFHAQTVTHPEDADADPLNEAISGVTLEDDVLYISEGDDDFLVDLSGFKQVLTKSGDQILLSGVGGSVTDETEDADADPANELQQLSLDGLTLGISQGNSVNLSAFSPWQAYTEGIFYDSGALWLGEPGIHPALFLERDALNLLDDMGWSRLQPSSLSMHQDETILSRLTTNKLEFFSPEALPVVRLDNDSNGSGVLSLWNMDGQLNSLLGNSDGSILAGQLDLFYRGHARIQLAATAQDASIITSFGPGGIVNVKTAYEPEDPTIGTLGIYQGGNLRTLLSANDDNAGSLQIFGPAHRNFLLGNKPGHPNTGALTLYNGGKKIADLSTSGNEAGAFSVLNPDQSENIFLHSIDTLPSYGRVTVFGGEMEQLEMTASETGAGVIRTIGPAENTNVQLSSLPENADVGSIKLFGEGEEIIRIGADTTQNYPGQMLFLEDGKKTLELGQQASSSQGVGNARVYGTDETLIVEVGSSSNPRAGKLSTYTFGVPIVQLDVNQDQAGMFNTYDRNGNIKTRISTSEFNEAGTFTSYLYEKPLVELTTSEFGSGFFRSYLSDVPTVQLSTNVSGAGSLWLANYLGYFEAVLGSNLTQGGGMLSLNYLGMPRMKSYSGLESPGVLELFNAQNQLNTKLGFVDGFPLGGALQTSTDGFLRNLISNNASGTAGYMATYGENGSLNCTLGNLNSFPNNGYIGVNDEAGNTMAGMFVNVSGNGVLFGTLTSFRMDHPERSDQEIWYAGLEGPEAAAYIRGTAQLERGRCTVNFPEHFLHVADPSTMTVLMTPLSGESKGLAVVEKGDKGFVVVELLGGQGTYSFDWEVKCVRKGYQDYRVVRDKPGLEAGLPLATDNGNAQAGIPPKAEATTMGMETDSSKQKP